MELLVVMGKVVGWGWGAGGTFDLYGDGYSVLMVVGKKGGCGGCHPSSSWWWLFSGGGGGEGKKRVGGITLHLHGAGYSVVVVVGKKGGGGGVTLHLHGDGYSVVVVVGKKGGCHPSSSWWWLFSGGGREKKGLGGVSPFIFMAMVIQWWWSWGKKGGVGCHPSSSWWWLFSGGGCGEEEKKRGGGVTLHLHGSGYWVVLVSGCRLRLATVNALQVQPAGLLQAEPFSEQDVVVDPLVVLRCDERVFRWEAGEVQVWWMGLQVRSLRSTGVMNWSSGEKLRARCLRSSGVMNGFTGKKLKKFRCDEWVFGWEA